MTDWLDEDEQRAWRGFVNMWLHLNGAFGEDFAAAGLSQPDHVLLVPLSETPDGRMRARDLAREVGWDKSRLSKHVGRMQRRGLVRAEGCPTDARGSVVVLTDDGRAAIERAAPQHVATVRKLFIDKLSAADLRALTRISRKVLDN
ncbi:MarR family winged helix-turn-helix transcriptional regulator [Mycobacterium sp. URHB0044]|uniref:MarR family winged helix-turn-helix transcriptional regulator n=1 Tax=Mycobacterium sp. URHB0044 TaxID=1380386 RepID=UPI00048C4330|nr:MarR family winged helix-turn-helix transcriptional regulator [Mycobacterium sp. URHB0044]